MKSTVKVYEGGVQSEITVEEFDKRKRNGEKFIKPEGMESYVLVSDEVYFEIMRPIWREDKKVQRNRECIHKKYCQCGDCAGCTKYEYRSDSFEFLIDNGGIDLPNVASAEEISERTLLYRELYDAMSGLDETDYKILEMTMDGESERAIAAKLGFKAMRSVQKRKIKVFSLLRKKLEKFF